MTTEAQLRQELESIQDAARKREDERIREIVREEGINRELERRTAKVEAMIEADSSEMSPEELEGPLRYLEGAT